ncbi:MAG: ABC-2 transporter permease [Eggerthellaceae bacterium]|nr:ABC-2 transporter permease [Eggerthellaceae bacterium]
MKAMIFSDLITMRRSLVQLVGIMAAIACLLAFGMETLVPVAACVAVMIPVMYVFTAMAYDELNGWEKFRLALPLSRSNVVAGRYAGMLLVCAAALVLGLALTLTIAGVAEALSGGMGGNPKVAALLLANNPPQALLAAGMLGALTALVMGAVVLPLTMRFGMTKGARVMPLVLVFVAVVVMGVFGDALNGFAEALLHGDAGVSPVALGVGAVAAVLAVYAASAALATRLYRTREL